MKTNEVTNGYKTNTTGAKQTKSIKDTYFYNINKYIENIPKTKDDKDDIPHKKPITQQQHKDFLRKYISDDITKYIALLIQVAQYEIPTLCQINQDLLYNLLLNNPLEDRQGEHIIKDNDKNAIISQFLKYIRDIISTDEGAMAKEGQILRLFFTSLPNTSFNQNIEQLDELIQAYQDEEKTKINTLYSTLISALGPVAAQLQLEADYQIEKEHDTKPQLGAYAQRLIDFSNAYKNKLKKLEQQQQQQTTQQGNARRGAIDIKELEKLIQEWKQQSDQINKAKEAKLKKLEQAIDATERKYKKIVKGKKDKRQQK